MPGNSPEEIQAEINELKQQLNDPNRKGDPGRIQRRIAHLNKLLNSQGRARGSSVSKSSQFDFENIGNTLSQLAPSLIGAGGAAGLFKLLQPLLQGGGQLAGQAASGFGVPSYLLDQDNSAGFGEKSANQIFEELLATQ